MRDEQEKELERMRKRRERQEREDRAKEKVMEAFPSSWPWPSYLHGGGLYADANCKYSAPRGYGQEAEPWTIGRTLQFFEAAGHVEIVKGNDGLFTTFGPPARLDKKYREQIELCSPLFKIDPPTGEVYQRVEARLSVEWWVELGGLLMQVVVEINTPHGCVWVDPSPHPDHPRRKRVTRNFQLILPDSLKELEQTKYAGVEGNAGNRVLWARA